MSNQNNSIEKTKDIPVTPEEEEYFADREKKDEILALDQKVVYKILSKKVRGKCIGYVTIFNTDNGYGYTLFDDTGYISIDEGCYDNPNESIENVANIVVADNMKNGIWYQCKDIEDGYLLIKMEESECEQFFKYCELIESFKKFRHFSFIVYNNCPLLIVLSFSYWLEVK